MLRLRDCLKCPPTTLDLTFSVAQLIALATRTFELLESFPIEIVRCTGQGLVAQSIAEHVELRQMLAGKTTTNKENGIREEIGCTVALQHAIVPDIDDQDGSSRIAGPS